MKDLTIVSEMNAITLYLIAGDDLAQQTAMLRLFGKPIIPPIWALGYHQCRWNYDSQDDLLDVS